MAYRPESKRQHDGRVVVPAHPIRDHPSQKLIVLIELPSVPGCLVGRGRVIRLVSEDDQTAPLTFAVQVARYRLDSLHQVLRELATNG
jgi:hypothetical protein